MCDAGNVAVFTKDGGYVVPQKMLSRTITTLDKIKDRSIRMKREGGVYNFRLWIPGPPEDRTNSNRYAPLQEADEEDQGFTWQG